MNGWKTDLTGLENGDNIPTELREYISYIEEATGVPISVVSVGPDREQTLFQDVKPVIA
jgi:adenylosuccinate synthase